MTYRKIIYETITICNICNLTAVRKLHYFDTINKLHNKFENINLCKECFNSTEEEKENRKGISSLEIDYYYK